MFEVFNEISSLILFFLIYHEKPKIYSPLIYFSKCLIYFEGREVNLCREPSLKGKDQYS
jgi:hypothetical protein